MSLGTLCMGGMLGPSSVSRIPERRGWKVSVSWLALNLGSCSSPPPHPGLLSLTLYYLVVSKMQIKQEEHVQGSQSATEEQPLCGAHSP